MVRVSEIDIGGGGGLRLEQERHGEKTPNTFSMAATHYLFSVMRALQVRSTGERAQVSYYYCRSPLSSFPIVKDGGLLQWFPIFWLY